jgi:hypothetical protein
MARKTKIQLSLPPTEADWLTTEDAKSMAAWLTSEENVSVRPSDRKLRLIACACLRTIWSYLNDKNRVYVEWQLDYPDLAPGRRAVLRGSKWAENLRNPASHVVSIIDVTRKGRLSGDVGLPSARQAELLREIVGNPFRPVAVLPGWLSADALRLATYSHVHRAFEQLPIVADALEDAGCTDESILAHLRSPGPHVRGCWALDLILGKD